MKTLNGHFPNLSKRMIMAGFFVFLVFSCSKNNSSSTKTAVHYCGDLDWKNTIGLSGYFTGVLDARGVLAIVAADIKEQDGTDKFIALHRDATNHILNDNPNLTFTYNQDNLVKIVMGDATGTITFTFDANSHLTNTDIESTEQSGNLSLKYTYTYDKNDDPVKITGHAISTGSSGTSTADYDITADYLTDKPNFLPLNPEYAPFTSNFAYGFFLSRHLINKWVIAINGTTDQGVAIPTINFTQQYTYTYNTDGYVSTMVHTGNSKNIYTFTYSNCH